MRSGLISLLIILKVFVSSISATDYYLSNNGNDKVRGTSPEASFKTIDRLNQVKLKPGDKVLFKSGDTFSGTLKINSSGKEGNPIVISSYGKGEKPVVSGVVSLSGFTKEGNNLYSTDCQDNIKYLYKNGKIMTLARYPDNGFLTVDDATKDYLIDADLPFSNNELKGATVYVNIRVWIIKNSRVKNNTNNKIEFESPVVFYSTSGEELVSGQGFNYYLDNKKEFLDNHNEWYYSAKEKKLYIYSETPLGEGDEISGTLISNGIVLAPGVSHVNIEGLNISGQTVNAITGQGNNTHIAIQNNDLSMIGAYGVYIEKTGSNLTIANNKIHDITGNGIRTMNAKNSLIEGNRVERIGTVVGYGIDGLNGSTGICVVSYEVNSTDSTILTHDNIIRNNYVSETGYNGIRFEGYNVLVEKNLVKNALLNMYDGGLIYTWSNKSPYTFNCTIKDNLVINNVKEKEGAHKIRLGIYLDYAVKNMVVENNTIINAGGGIMTNGGSTNTTIKKNLVYGCESGIKLIQKNWTVHDPHHVMGNTIVCKKNQGTTLSLDNHEGTKTSLGSVDNNTYISLNEKFHIGRVVVDEEQKTVETFTLKGWQNETGVDKNSTFFVPEKDGNKYPYSDIFVNETEGSKTFPLDSKYEYLDLDGNVLTKEITLGPRQAKVVFYK